MSKWTRLSAPLTNKRLPFCSMSNQRYGIRKNTEFNNVSSLSKLKNYILLMHKKTTTTDHTDGSIHFYWMD